MGIIKTDQRANFHHQTTVVLMGPEKPMSVLEDQLKGINWDATGVGYGVRGSPVQNLTVRLEGKRDAGPLLTLQ